jgi:hypothetical protein
MLNFPFYNKHINHLVLDKNLRDYIKKSNTDSFNKFSEKQQHQQQYKNIKTNLSNSLLSSSLINYRNYSDTFANDNIDCNELENEDYLCNFYDLNDDNIDFKNNHNNHNNNNKTDNHTNDNNSIIKKLYIFIGGTTIIGFLFFYYI